MRAQCTVAGSGSGWARCSVFRISTNSSGHGLCWSTRLFFNGGASLGLPVNRREAEAKRGGFGYKKKTAEDTRQQLGHRLRPRRVHNVRFRYLLTLHRIAIPFVRVDDWKL